MFRAAPPAVQPQRTPGRVTGGLAATRASRHVSAPRPGHRNGLLIGKGSAMSCSWGGGGQLERLRRHRYHIRREIGQHDPCAFQATSRTRPTGQTSLTSTSPSSTVGPCTNGTLAPAAHRQPHPPTHDPEWTRQMRRPHAGGAQLPKQPAKPEAPQPWQRSRYLHIEDARRHAPELELSRPRPHLRPRALLH